MICKHCNQEIADDAKFCPHCGSPVALDDMSTNDETTASGTDFNQSSQEQQGTHTAEQEHYQYQNQSTQSGPGPAYDPNYPVPGKGAATASLVLGIVSVALWVAGMTAIVSVILGIIGLIQANKAKNQGFVGGMQKAGFILSLIGLIGGGLVFVACIACVSIAGIASMPLIDFYNYM